MIHAPVTLNIDKTHDEQSVFYNLLLESRNKLRKIGRTCIASRIKIEVEGRDDVLDKFYTSNDFILHHIVPVLTNFTDDSLIGEVHVFDTGTFIGERIK